MTELTPEGKLLDLIRQAQDKKKLRKELKIFTKVNTMLIGLIVIIMGIFLTDIFTSEYNIPELSVDFPEQKDEILPKPIEFEDDIKVTEIIPEKQVSISKEDAVKNLNLLGIVTGDNNQAIIEDRQSKETRFFYKGDNFREFKILDIKDSEVILEYKGERIELRM